MKPSRWFYGFAVVVFLAGAAFAARSVAHAMDRVGDAQRVVMPGAGEVTLSAAGTYTLFYEYRSVIGDTVYGAPAQPPSLRVTVTERATGQPVALTRPGTTSSYSVPGRAGVSLLSFRVDRPGVYEIRAISPAGEGGSRFVLAVGRGAALGLLRGLFLGIGVALGAGVLAVAIAAVVYLLRRTLPRPASGGWSTVGTAG